MRRINITHVIIYLIIIGAYIFGTFYQKQQAKNLIRKISGNKELIQIDKRTFLSDSSHYFITKTQGYGGSLVGLVIINNRNIIQKFEVIQHSETPSYFKKCLPLIKSLKQKSLTDAVMNSDAVSGATLSSYAINQSLQQVNKTDDFIRPPFEKIPVSTWIVLALIILSLLEGFLRNKLIIKIIQYTLAVISVAVIGFWLNTPLSFSFLSRFIVLEIPPFYQYINLYLLLAYALISIIIFKSNNYCKQICPFGRLQDLCSLALKPKQNKRIGQKAFQLPSWLTLVALLPVLLFQTPGVSGYEIYSGVFDFTLSIFLYGVLVMVVLLLAYTKRPWCKFFCPTGYSLNFILKRYQNLWKRK